VDETEKGWFIAWIDSSPKALAKAEASMKKDRATMSDEQRERMLIAEQIERAAADVDNGHSESPSPPVEEGLKREEGAEKVVLSISAKPAALNSTSTPAISSGLKINSLKPGVNPLKANPLKRPNVFKTASTSGTNDSDKTHEKKRAAPMSAAERLIIEDQERKRRRMDRESIV